MSENKETTLQRKRARMMKEQARAYEDFAAIEGDTFETDLTELAISFQNGSDE